MRRALALIAMLAPVATAAACSSGSVSGPISCGGGPIASAHGQESLHLASCAGEIGMSNPVPKMTVRVGTRIRVSGLVPRGYTNPESAEPSVVVVTSSMPSRAELRALAVGTATVTLSTPYCLLRHLQTHCPAMKITVTT